MTKEYAELEGFDPDEFEDDPRDEPSDGGVREPKKPILPILPGEIKLEKEKIKEEEKEHDLCLCSD